MVQGVELHLKHVQGVGLYGWSSVCETILGEWLEDISQNQVQSNLTISDFLMNFDIHECMRLHKLLVL